MSSFGKEKESMQDALVNKIKNSYMKKKLNRMFGTSTEVKALIINGFKTGAILGSAIGLVFGLGISLKSKNFMILPMAVLSSAASFGFFMSIGATIRTNN